MKNEDIFGIGMLIALLSTAILYSTNGRPAISWTSIVWLIFITGLVLINSSYQTLKDKLKQEMKK